MSGLKREDEYRLKELTQLAEEKGRTNLTEDQQLVLQLLEDRYNKFLDEGLRKLRENAQPPQSPRPFRGLFSSGRASPRSELSPVSDALPTTASANGSFGATSAASGSPSLIPPPQCSGKLWTWILDTLVVGGIPYANQTTDTPGHLCELNEQCFQRRSRVAAVVSCLDVEESVPPGFAVAKDWEMQHSVNTFFYVTCIPRQPDECGDAAPDIADKGNGESLQNAAASSSGAAVEEFFSSEEMGGIPIPADPAFEEIISVCENVKRVCAAEPSDRKKASASTDSLKHRLSLVGQKVEKKKVVFVHCKAGLGRSWAFAMCYLMCALHKTYEESEAYLQQLRSFDPKPCHVAFAKRFAAYVRSPRFSMQSDEEERYIKILADVLSLSPQYRTKLIQDVEKLT